MDRATLLQTWQKMPEVAYIKLRNKELHMLNK